MAPWINIQRGFQVFHLNQIQSIDPVTIRS